MGLHKVLFNRVFNLQISLWEGAYSLLFGTEYSNVFFLNIFIEYINKIRLYKK